MTDAVTQTAQQEPQMATSFIVGGILALTVFAAVGYNVVKFGYHAAKESDRSVTQRQVQAAELQTSEQLRSFSNILSQVLDKDLLEPKVSPAGLRSIFNACTEVKKQAEQYAADKNTRYTPAFDTAVRSCASMGQSEKRGALAPRLVLQINRDMLDVTSDIDDGHAPGTSRAQREKQEEEVKASHANVVTMADWSTQPTQSNEKTSK